MNKHFLSVCAALFALMILFPVMTRADENVYAILYEDGTMVFQHGDKPRYGKTVVKKYMVSSRQWWYREVGLIRVVDFADKISPTSTNSWFFNCMNLNRVKNIQNLDTSNVTDMLQMFSGCSGLTKLDLSHFDTSNVTNMRHMFNECRGLTELDVSSFDTSNVTNMGYMFGRCSGLTKLDVSRFDTSNVTNMDAMFSECSELTELDVSRFDTSNVTNMGSMFEQCHGLTELDVSRFDTSNVTDMSSMFRGCSGLTELDVSRFDTSNVTDMSSMFRDCSGVTELDVSRFDTSNVSGEYGMSHMFSGCSGVTELDVSHFDTSNVTDMGWMFVGCSRVTELDISSFNTSRVHDMSCMFAACHNLKTIFVSSKFSLQYVKDTIYYKNSDDMFYQCESLIGGNGAKYDENHVDKLYARIDRPSVPGYFTAKPPKITDAVKNNGQLSVTLENAVIVTVAVSYFDQSGKFLSADMRQALAGVGGVTFELPGPCKARVAVFDSEWRPLCDPATVD